MSSANESSPIQHFRHFFTTEGLKENFRKNCLCDPTELMDLLDRLDDRFSRELSLKQDDSGGAENVTVTHVAEEADERILGGCLLVGQFWK